jgi:hypothetical protein
VKGIICFDVDIDVRIDSCRFDGGAVWCYDSANLGITNSSFSNGPGPASVRLEGGSGILASVTNNRFDHCVTGIQSYVDEGSGSVAIVGNTFDQCGTAMVLGKQFQQVEGNVITRSTGDGISCGSPFGGVTTGVLANNRISHCGGNGVSQQDYDYADLTLSSNTIFDNAKAGIAVRVGRPSGGPGSFSHNVVYRNHSFGLVVDDSIGPALSCNDWFANDSGAVAGTPQSPEDLTVDPLFCDVANDNVYLAANSPLLNAPGCGLIGALGQGCETTPTLVTAFTAERTTEGVRLAWSLGDPSRFPAVWLERSDGGSQSWTRLTVEIVTDGTQAVALDRSVLPEHAYSYRLTASNGGGVVVLGEPVTVAAGSPLAFALQRVSPNPSTGPLHVEFSLARAAFVSLDLYDVAGRRVAKLASGTLAAGVHRVDWPGMAGRSPGVYSVRYRYPGGAITRSVIQVR